MKEIFDLNEFDTIIENDIENVDVHEIYEAMVKLDHKWFTGDAKNPDELDNEDLVVVPTETMIYKDIRKKLIQCYTRMIENKENYTYMTSGGIRVQTHYDDENDEYWAEIMYCPVESIF